MYVGNLPVTASVDELLNLVHFGPLKSIRVLPKKLCVFLSFLDAGTAAAFHANATIKKLSLHGQEQDWLGEAVPCERAGAAGDPAEQREPKCVPSWAGRVYDRGAAQRRFESVWAYRPSEDHAGQGYRVRTLFEYCSS